LTANKSDSDAVSGGAETDGHGVLPFVINQKSHFPVNVNLAMPRMAALLAPMVG
jgi:hypothetical protein